MSFLQDDVMDSILDNLWGGQTYGLTPPGTYYVCLLQVLPATDGTGAVEADYTDYARFAVTNNLTEFPAATAGLKSNASVWDYGVAGSGPQDVVGFAFVDDPTDPIDSVNLWAVIDLTGAPVTITNGADVHFAAASIDLTNCIAA